MTKSKLVVFAAALLIAIGLFVTIGYLHWKQGVYVSIRNKTQDVLTDICVTYAGGVVRIAELEPDASSGRHINPSSESDLELVWFDSSGVEQSQKVDVYLEPYYRGDIVVTVEAPNRISWRDETWISPF